MMKYGGVMIGSDNARVLGEFYTNVLGKPDYHDGDSFGWSDGAQFFVSPHSDVHGESAMPARIILSLIVDDVKIAFDTLIGFGAQAIAEPYLINEASGIWLATVSDPDGNYVQIARSWV